MTKININDLTKLQSPELKAFREIEKQFRPSPAMRELFKQSEEAGRYLRKLNSAFDGNLKQMQAMTNALAGFKLDSKLSRFTQEMNIHGQHATKLSKIAEGINIENDRLAKIVKGISTKINFPDLSFKIAEFAKAQNIATEILKDFPLPATFAQELENLKNIRGIDGLKQELINSGIGIETVDTLVEDIIDDYDIGNETVVENVARKDKRAVILIALLILFRIFAADIKKQSWSGTLITYAVMEFLDYCFDDEGTSIPESATENNENEDNPVPNEVDKIEVLNI